MQDNEVRFAQDIYSEHLTTINGVNFTPREIDVISCLLNARRTSQIASILFIAPRTVTTHFRNIMLKLECNSQEGIINFIENSHKLSILREYYSSLIIELAFKKSLKEISKLKHGKSSACMVVHWQNLNLKNALVNHLQNHLNLVGVNAEIREHGLEQKLENIENSDKILLLLIERKDQGEILEEFSRFDCVNLSEQQNYYSSVFQILKKLLPDVSLEIILANFRNQYEGMQNSSEAKNSKIYRVEEFQKKDNKRLHKANQIWKSRKWFVLTVLVVGMFTVVFLTRPIQAPNTVEETSIRSDLIIPTGAALINRPELIPQINSKLKGQEGIQTVALVGPGGAGKTTLARQYAHQQKVNVIWEVNAETHESLKSSFENLAQALARTEENKKILRGLQDIKNPDEREGKITQFVKERLKVHSNWFLLYDNVEKFSDIQKHFPQDPSTWGQGKVIVTTQDTNIQNNKYVTHTIQIGELNSDQKFNLFTKIMSQGSTGSFILIQNENTKGFLEKIPPFPLDISVAAYYLRSANITYNNYLENLAQNDKNFEEVQKNLLKEAGDYAKTRYSIIALSLQNLINTHKEFGDLLLFVSLLDSQNIPRELLDKYKGNAVVDNFIYHLKKYSLITNEVNINYSNTSSFSIHRSVKAIMLTYLIKRLNLHKNDEIFKLIASVFEKYLFEIENKEDVLKMRMIISHCEMFLSFDNLLTVNVKGSLSGELGYIYYYLGRDMRAKQLLEESLIKLSKYNSKNYTRIARMLLYLGNLHRTLGDYETGRKLLKQSHSIYQKHYPNSYKNYSDFAWILTSLGIINKELGNYEEAKNLLEQGIDINRNLLEDKDIRIAWPIANLGIVYNYIGDYEKARTLLEESLRLSKMHFPQTHVKIAWILSFLGDTYINLGNYKEAKVLLDQGLVGFDNCFGKNHLKSARVLRDLGRAWLLEGNLNKAEEFLKKSYKIYKENNHIDIYTSLEYLADLYLKKCMQLSHNKDEHEYQNNKNRAINYLKQSLEILRISFPKDFSHATRIRSKLNSIEH